MAGWADIREGWRRGGEQATPPAHLSERARYWWQEVLLQYELDAHHVLLLTAAAEELDTAEQAREVVQREGMSYLDRYKQVRPHPMLDVGRKARNSFRLLVRELGLDASAPAEPRIPTQPGGR
jgi:phage terminase small subunit